MPGWRVAAECYAGIAERVTYTIKARKEVRNIKGIDYLYNEKYAVCDQCGR